jgi:hypothetical protein
MKYDKDGYIKSKYNKERERGYSSEYKEKEKPLYYSEYTVTESEKNTFDKYNCIFFVLLSVFVLGGSIVDLSYSYIKLDNCQEISYFTTLNDWFRVNGIYGVSYYFFILILVSILSKPSYQGYIRMVKTSNDQSEKCEIFYKVCATFVTVVMLLLMAIGCYIYFSFFYSYCTSYSIIVYMWIRLITGFITSIGLIVFINY